MPTAKCSCKTCSGHIEFDTMHAGQTVACPHCGYETRLDIPPTPALPAAAPVTASEPTAQIAGGQGNLNLVLGIAGSFVLVLGVFSPLVRVPILGTVNYFHSGTVGGIIILFLAFLSLLLAASRRYRWLWYTALGSAAWIGFTFSAMLIVLHRMKVVPKEGADGPLAGLAALLLGVFAEGVQMDWGWGVLLVGIGLILAAAAVGPAPSGFSAPPGGWGRFGLVAGLLVVGLPLLSVFLPGTNDLSKAAKGESSRKQTEPGSTRTRATQAKAQPETEPLAPARPSTPELAQASAPEPARPRFSAWEETQKAIAAVKITSWRWRTDDFGMFLMADFTIHNGSIWDVTDLEIRCFQHASSGTVVATDRRTIYEIIPAGETRTFRDVNMGFIGSQAAYSVAEVVGLELVGEVTPEALTVRQKWLAERKAAEEADARAAEEKRQAALRSAKQKAQAAEAALVKFVLEQASNGLPWAQCALGKRYLTGSGVEKDEALARLWLEKAAAQGNLEARAILEKMPLKQHDASVR